MTDIMQEVPVIDASKANDPTECRRLAAALSDVGCFIFRGTAADEVTPRVTEMMVRYFRQPDEVKALDARPDIFYQVGWTPPFTETARPRPDRLIGLSPENQPTPYEGSDPKERFMAQVGPRPTTKKYAQFSAPPVIPAGFPDWSENVHAWGDHAYGVMMVVARMAAIGFALPEDAFTSRLEGGQHLYAPTGSDLSKYGAPGTVLAANHGDLNFLSVHGPANYPFLRVLTRDGRWILVRVPKGCMLVQAGMQFQHLTGGMVLEGLHEVVVNELMKMMEAWRIAQAFGLVPWRASTTLFGHVHSDSILEPLGHFATDEALAKYPRMTSGEQVQRELMLLGLAAGATKH